MSWLTFKGIRSSLIFAVALVLLALPAASVASADTPPPASIAFYVAKTARFGQTVQLSARLVDAARTPIGGARVAFLVPSTFFLGTTGDVVIAEIPTNKEGVAEVEYEVRQSGWLELRAEFRGNDRYAAARNTARILVDEAPHQLYVEHAGVQVPGLNVPLDARQAHGEAEVVEAEPPPSGLAALWPTVSVWPIALVLLTVWSLYGVAVSQMFRIASAGGGGLAPAHPRGDRGSWITAASGESDQEYGGFRSLPSNGEDK